MTNEDSFVWSDILRERLKQARERKGMSQPRAADSIGVESNTLWRWENGYVKKIPMEGLCELSRAYEVPVGWLIGQEEALSPQEDELVSMYRKASPDFQRSILAALHAWHGAPPDYERESSQAESHPLAGAKLPGRAVLA